MEPTMPKVAIQLLESIAHNIHGALRQMTFETPARVSAIRGLARLDQKIAEYKDRAGLLGLDDCTYLED